MVASWPGRTEGVSTSVFPILELSGLGEGPGSREGPGVAFSDLPVVASYDWPPGPSRRLGR
jgi:hypothetical protein